MAPSLECLPQSDCELIMQTQEDTEGSMASKSRCVDKLQVHNETVSQKKKKMLGARERTQ